VSLSFACALLVFRFFYPGPVSQFETFLLFNRVSFGLASSSLFIWHNLLWNEFCLLLFMVVSIRTGLVYQPFFCIQALDEHRQIDLWGSLILTNTVTHTITMFSYILTYICWSCSMFWTVLYLSFPDLDHHFRLSIGGVCSIVSLGFHLLLKRFGCDLLEHVGRYIKRASSTFIWIYAWYAICFHSSKFPWPLWMHHNILGHSHVPTRIPGNSRYPEVPGRKHGSGFWCQKFF